ncbi:lysine N-methyltransferase, H3 lysine-4 specific [Seminavis robusta]|uniref:Lysine N-methyltransferase, H3 lysine-4 specific n=1 Tax=Seminavis robusta TaxID=568900 RepID=A0A9N8DA10_9STRA|nr:lysine N-methyltransferase, H3 lysine-4 specific [Seminavis robusta]|eukprot:Sro59_g034050.1 lysine N-methyltransferase, H3 lysine-4 specific (225) ;mRNA; r:23210-23884
MMKVSRFDPVYEDGETKVECPDELLSVPLMLVKSLSKGITTNWKPDMPFDKRVFHVGMHPVEGVGKALYASQFIPKGSYILTFCGPLVNEEEATKRDLANYGREMGNELQIGDDFYVYLQEPSRLINHSCEPNAGIIDDTVLIAAQDIQKDEEICFDYSTTMDEPEVWQMECMCGAANCRGYAADFRTLPIDTRKKYLQCGLVQNFIRKKYDKETGEPSNPTES